MEKRPTQRAFRARFRNIVLDWYDTCGDELVFRVHIGNRAALPAEFLELHCRESRGERLWRLGRNLVGWLLHPCGFSSLSYRYCRIRVPRRSSDDDVPLISCLKIEDAFRLLRSAGFWLYDDRDPHTWSSYDVYWVLMREKRLETPMQTLHFDPKIKFFSESGMEA